MITLKSNIEFLTDVNNRQKKLGNLLTQPTKDLIANIDYAIETLKMVEQIKDDVWDEKRINAIGANGNDGLHYE